MTTNLPATPAIAFLGTGRMGAPMAANLVPYQATFARLTMRRRRGSAVWRFRQAM